MDGVLRQDRWGVNVQWHGTWIISHRAVQLIRTLDPQEVDLKLSVTNYFGNIYLLLLSDRKQNYSMFYGFKIYNPENSCYLK